MRTLKLKFLFLFTIFLFLSFSSTSPSQVTYIDVYPSGGSEDALNVQSALEEVDVGGIVHLTAGIFDFQWQNVWIYKPCVLEGEIDGNGNLLTTIKNAGDPNVPQDEDAIDILSGGVTVKDLKFEGLGRYGIFLWPEPYWGTEANNETVTISNNNFGDLTEYSDWGYPIGCWGVPCSVEILDNTIGECYIGMYLGVVSGTQLIVEGNTIADCRQGIITVNNACTVMVKNNTINAYYTGIFEIYNNLTHPHYVMNNSITLDDYNACGIEVWSGNCLVEGNIMKSYGTSTRNGVVSYEGSANHTIVNNDFSGLTTWDSQVVILGGRNHLVRGNVFGPSNGEGPDQSYLPTAVFLTSYFSDPTFNCTLMNNNYRGCQLPGWSYDESGNLGGGCVLILNYGDGGVYDNLVNETGRFPEGTGGPKKQVVEIPDQNVYNNRIIGHSANEIAFLEDEYPGIGQRIKESREDMMLISHIFEELGDPVKFMGKRSPNNLIHNNKNDDLEEQLIPKSYVLFQNYPNPFNPTTTIGFGVEEKTRVKIVVINSIGEKVAVILNKEMEPGFHQIEFNGAYLPSGIYFYQLKTGNFVETKKMLLLK